MNLKSLIIGMITAVIVGIVLHLIVVGILGFVAATIYSTFTILDPLYASERFDAVWTLVFAMMQVQLFQTFISASLAGAVVGFVAPKIQSCWVYPLCGFISAIIHILLLLTLSMVVSLLSTSDTMSGLWGITFVLATAVGFLIGVLSAFTVQKWGS